MTARRLDQVDLLLLADPGYLPQAPEDSEVVFTLLAQRYKRCSLVITATYP